MIAMVAIGEGAKRRVEQTFEAMGTNLLIVLPGSASSGGMMGGYGYQGDADLGRFRGDPQGAPGRASRRRRCCVPALGRPGRGPELDDGCDRARARTI